MKKFLESRYFPYAASFFLIVPSLVWIFSDNSVWPWDSAWYGEVSVDLFYKLNHSFSEWPKLMMSAFGIKAPAIAWFGQFFVPLSGITESVDRALMMQIILAQFFSLVLIYKIVSQLTQGNKALAFFGSLTTASAPLFVGMSHQYFVESLQLLAVTAFLFVFVNIKNWNIFNSIILLVVTLSYAMLVKATSPLYIIFPALFSLYYLIKRVSVRAAKAYFFERKHHYFYVVGLIFFLVAFGWYAVNGNRLVNFMKLASSGSAAELYGTKSPFLNKMVFWISNFQKSFFLPQVMCVFIIVAGACLLNEIFFKRNEKFGPRKALILISFLSIAAVLVVFSFQTNEETRYLLPLLPYLAIIICLSLYRLGESWVNYAVLLVFGIQFIFVHGITLGLAKFDGSKISPWSVPVNNMDTRKKDIEKIIERTCTKESSGKISVIGVEYPWLNANSVEYYAMQNKLNSHLSCFYTSLGYAENDEGKAWRRLTEEIKPPYIITTFEIAPAGVGAFNAVSAPIIRRVEQSGIFEEKKYPNGEFIRIFKNKIE